LIFSSQGVLSQSVRQGIETLLKIYDVSSTAHKGESRGVIEDKTPVLGKESGVFCFMRDKPGVVPIYCNILSKGKNGNDKYRIYRDRNYSSV